MFTHHVDWSMQEHHLSSLEASASYKIWNKQFPYWYSVSSWFLHGSYLYSIFPTSPPDARDRCSEIDYRDRTIVSLVRGLPEGLVRCCGSMNISRLFQNHTLLWTTMCSVIWTKSACSYKSGQLHQEQPLLFWRKWIGAPPPRPRSPRPVGLFRALGVCVYICVCVFILQMLCVLK